MGAFKIAQRRMISLKVIDTDLFLDMPQSARLLYYDLNIRADDDGFVASPKKIQRMIGCSDDDFKLLIAKQFIIPFESGVCVIRHWRIHNYIRSDRYSETLYQNEKEQLTENNGAYEINDLQKDIPNVIPDVIPTVDDKTYQRDTQDRIGKDRIGKDKKDTKIHYDEFVSMTEDEYKKLMEQYGEVCIKEKIIDLNLWKGSKGKKTKSDYLTLLTWIRKDSKTIKPKEIQANSFDFGGL